MTLLNTSLQTGDGTILGAIRPMVWDAMCTTCSSHCICRNGNCGLHVVIGVGVILWLAFQAVSSTVSTLQLLKTSACMALGGLDLDFLVPTHVSREITHNLILEYILTILRRI